MRTPQFRILICTPCYNGQVAKEYMHSVVNLMNYYSTKEYIKVDVITMSGSDLFRMRNVMAERFYRSDYTHLFFVDADTGFSPELLMKMINFDQHFVGVLCPRKKPDGGFVCSELLLGNTVDKGFQRISGIGCGLTLLKKEVFHILREEYDELFTSVSKYYQEEGLSGPVHQPFAPRNKPNGIILSEDLSFASRWRDIGMPIWACVDEPVEHVGTHTYRGSLR